MIGDFNDKINFPHVLLLTNRQVGNLSKAFTNYLSTNSKLSKTQISKMIESGGFFGRLLGPLLKTRLASAADAQIHKKILGSAKHLSGSASHSNTIPIIPNDEMKDIIEIVKSLEDSSLLPEGVSETIQNKAKEQRGGFLSMLLGTLGVSLLGNILAGKGINRAGEGIARAEYGNKRQDYEKKKIFNTASSFN